MIHNVSDNTYVESKWFPCEYHIKNPNKPNYAGCTCTIKYDLIIMSHLGDEPKDVGDYDDV